LNVTFPPATSISTFCIDFVIHQDPVLFDNDSPIAAEVERHLGHIAIDRRRDVARVIVTASV
jgi:hypothetical protein